MVKKAYVPDRGQVVWVDLNPTKGHEQKNKRPAVVLSPRAYNKKTGLMVAVPVTSYGKGYPFEVELKGKKIKGVVLSDQLRTLDWKARKVTYIENIPIKKVTEVQARVVALLAT